MLEICISGIERFYRVSVLVDRYLLALGDLATTLNFGLLVRISHMFVTSNLNIFKLIA